MNGLPEIHLESMSRTVGHWLPRTYEIPDMEDRDPFDLNAPYQRASVWTMNQRIALIKSLYMGLPVGAVIVSHLPYRKGNPYSYRVVDGKQRVETVRMFATDQFAIPAAWLRDEDRIDKGDWNGLNVYFSQASVRFQRWFGMGAKLPSLEFKPEQEWMGRDPKNANKAIWRARNDAEILKVEAELYGLINGAGTAQTDEDMARAAQVASG